MIPDFHRFKSNQQGNTAGLLFETPKGVSENSSWKIST